VAVEKEHLEQLLDWRNKPEFRKPLPGISRAGYGPAEPLYEEKVLNDPSTLMFSIAMPITASFSDAAGLLYIQWVYKHGTYRYISGGITHI